MTKRMGSVDRLPSGKWRARVAVGTRADGKVRRETKTFDSKVDAERWCITRGVEMGARPDLSAGVTLSSVWDLYKDDKGKRLAKKTMEVYTSLMKVHWLPTMGETDISAITCATIQYRLDGMTHENALHAKRCLSSVLTYAVGRGLLAKNPMHGHKFDIPAKEADVTDFEDDPFAAIEDSATVWDLTTVLECYERIQGLPLEPAWLACVGGGLRVEEAMALRKVDVRRVEVEGVKVTQLAVHGASTPLEREKATKTKQSVRIVTMLPVIGDRYWELREAVEKPKGLVCTASPGNQNRAWHKYFEPPKLHKRMSMERVTRGRLEGLPYIPLARMRNTHATLMQQAGIIDSINSKMHGNSERVIYDHYLKPDTSSATIAASKHLRLVV
jgi:integrase